MNIRPLAGVLGQSLEQGEKGRAVGGVHRREESSLLLIGDLVRAGEQLVCGRREEDGMGATIARVLPTLDEAAVLEVVDEADHPVAVDPEGVGEPLLRLAVAMREVNQEPEMLGLDAERRQTLCESLRAVRSELREQEACPGGESGRLGLRGIGHPQIVSGDCHGS
jgi:hypothetical protein